MRKSRLIEPYDRNGRSNLGFANKQSGVYMIYKNDKLVYIGYSATNLYKTCTRHFQEWNSKYQRVVTYARVLKHNTFKVRVILCSAGRAEKLEKALIVKYKPKDNPDKLPGYRLDGYELRAFEDFKDTPASNYEDIEVPF